MRRLFVWPAIASALFFAAPARAAPVAPSTYRITQPDDTIFAATDWGDESAYGVETSDGYTIVLDAATGFWKYAVLEASGQLVPSALVVGWDDPGAIPRHLRPMPAGPAPDLGPSPGPSPSSGAPPAPGTHRLLVLLVEFTPAQSRGSTEADWAAHAFSGGIATAPDSVADYWSEVSYAQLALSAAAESFGTLNNGVVLVTLGYAHPNTDPSDPNRQLTADAIVASDPFVDYGSFDDNADGYLSSDELHLLVVARGYERSYGGANVCTGAGSTWGHHWSLFGAVPPPTVDGVVVGATEGAPSPGPQQGGYNQIGEWHCSTSDTPGHMATIGITAHELGHDMGTGVPDLYDTDSSSRGIGRWALQAGGSWNTTGAYSGMTPAWPDAWSRSFLGILTPAEPSLCADDWTFPRVETATGPARGVVRLRANPAGVDWDWGSPGSGEYFLVENRQLVGFDAALPGSGLLIWHIHEGAPGDNGTNADEGTCPPGNLRLVMLEQADGDFDLECYGSCGGACNSGDAGDPWRAGGATAFFGSSTPSSDLVSGAETGVAVRDISASGATMTADLGYGPCDDGDACTTADACSQGACVGTPYSCNDGNACTNDSCDGAGACTHANTSGACDDGEPCTSVDTCAGGVCAGTPFSCDDGDVCTNDICNPDGTCSNTGGGGPCDDGADCTWGDTCTAGVCSGAPYSCADGNPCTDDGCNGDGTCAFVPNALPCDDAQDCTTGDACAGGSCAGVAYGCGDGNPCTLDTCDGSGGCGHVPTAAACDDGLPCTSSDICVAGRCAGTPYDCDDGDPCTADACDGSGICSYSDADGGPCDNADPCAAQAQCSGGVCLTTFTYDCFTLDPCVLGQCDGSGGCAYLPQSGPTCDDGLACTTGDQCVGGSCQGTALMCDDDNPCTTDSCNIAGVCTHLDNAASCDDGDACTFGDSCNDASCTGTPYQCDDGNSCTDDSCDGDGECTLSAHTRSCDDEDPCTTNDACGGAVCSGTTYTCDDGNPCTADQCLGDGECRTTEVQGDCDDGDACTTNDTCGGGECAGAPFDCDDGDPCTTDRCDGTGGCGHEPDLSCDDPPAGSSDGCGCALGGAPAQVPSVILLLAAALLGAGRRRTKE